MKILLNKFWEIDSLNKMFIKLKEFLDPLAYVPSPEPALSQFELDCLKPEFQDELSGKEMRAALQEWLRTSNIPDDKDLDAEDLKTIADPRVRLFAAAIITKDEVEKKRKT